MSAIGPRQRAAIARIDLRQGNGKPGQGTGFAVARDRVLTAWHVMKTGSQHAAVFGGDRAPVALGDVLAVGPNKGGRDDWALVACKVPDDIEPIELAERPGAQGRWRSRAFPIAVATASYPAGEIVAWNDGLYTLSLDAAMTGVELRGASGAPVFVHERAVGLLIETRGDAGGLLAVDAASILAAWPAGETPPAAVPHEIPYELWVRHALTAWLADNAAARELASALADLEPILVTPIRLARALMTSSPEVAIDFVKRTITGDKLEALLDLSYSLWVHHSAAARLCQTLFVDRRLGVLRCSDSAMWDHLCCAEGLAHPGLPRCRRETLKVTYMGDEPDGTAVWRYVRAAMEKLDAELVGAPDEEIGASVRHAYVAIAVLNEPPSAAIAGVRGRGVGEDVPIVVYSKTANAASAASSGGTLIVPTPDPEREQQARLRWAARGPR